MDFLRMPRALDALKAATAGAPAPAPKASQESPAQKLPKADLRQPERSGRKSKAEQRIEHRRAVSDEIDNMLDRNPKKSDIREYLLMRVSILCEEKGLMA